VGSELCLKLFVILRSKIFPKCLCYNCSLLPSFNYPSNSKFAL